MLRTLPYGTSQITYTLLFEARRTLRIEVHPDQSVWVKAPEGTTQPLIDERLLRRAGWIQKQQRYYQAVQPPRPARQYVSGESFRYLGYQHRLKVQEGQPEQVRRVGGRLVVQVRRLPNEARVGTLVERWYRQRADRVFAERLAHCLRRFVEYDQVLAPSIELRRMSGRWGSCTTQGKIFLNPHLVMASTTCIDYVITHELAHLIEHNHGPKFYRLLSNAMPDWLTRKQKLERSRWD